MEYVELILSWFCYGWTAVTFPATTILILFSLWVSGYDARTLLEGIPKFVAKQHKKMMTGWKE